MPEVGPGIGLSIAGLLLGIKGIAGGYVLIREIFTSNKGMEYYAIRYETEGLKFKAWSERVKAEDEANCLIKKETKEIQDAVARIVALIQDTQQTIGEKLIKKYEMTPIPAPIPGRPGGPGARPAFHAESVWIAHFRRELKKQPKPHEIAWAVKDKDKFEETVNRLKQLNQDLEELLRPRRFDEQQQATTILSNIDPQLLQPLLLSLSSNYSPLTASPKPLLPLAALLKLIQAEDAEAAAARVTHIKIEELTITHEPKTKTDRSDGYYEAAETSPSPVLVEWKYIDATNEAMSAIVTRINALGGLLSAANPPELSRLTCLGTFDDTAYQQITKGNRRIGLVYRIPENVGIDGESPSLLQLIQRRGTRPPLGARFELARRLVRAVALLHATNWLHKSLHSGNILFENKTFNDLDITVPYIFGFQYSRPAAEISIETRPIDRPELKIYYHKDVNKGWNKIREIYSLGIVLLEVAFWRPVFEKEFTNMEPKEISKSILDSLEGEFGRDLVGLVGTVFVSVIMVCLKGQFGVETGNTSEEGKVLNKSFWHKVVEPLAECKA